MTRFRSFVCLFISLPEFGAVLCAQPSVAITPRARAEVAKAYTHVNLRFDVQLVQVPVTVTDLNGKPLTSLQQDSFRIFEDDVERSITSFTLTDVPISATVVFDSSRSMKGRMADARAAVEQFLKTSGANDEFSLVRFSDKAEILNRFTKDADEISGRLSGVEPKGWTALFDAVCLAAQHVRKGQNQRKVVVVFSDGGDNNSRYSEPETIKLLREADVEVYAVSMFERPKSLERITEETGGRALWVKRLDELPAAIEMLSRQIRSEYLVGYSPGAVQNDGKYHRIRIEVHPPEGLERVRASWKHGYTAPGE